MNDKNLNEYYPNSSQQPAEKKPDDKTYESNSFEMQIIRKLTSLEQAIDTSIKEHGDKSLALTRKKDSTKNFKEN